MPSALLLSFLLASARAQPAPAPAPAAAPAAAPDASSGTVATSSGEVVGHGLKTATGEAPVAPKGKSINVSVHKDAAEWEPVSVKVIVDAGITENSVTYKPRGRAKAVKSAAKSVARVHPSKGDKMLVVAVYPAAFRKLNTFLEIRLQVSEGFLEEAKIAAVIVRPGQQAFEYGADDSFSLSARGVEFSEEFPAEASLRISAINLKPGQNSRNAGAVKNADFGGQELGTVNLFYGTNEIGGRPAAARRRGKPAP